MRVGAPRIGPAESGGQGGQFRNGGGPEPECPVHVDPGAVRFRDGDRLGEGVEGARMQVAGLQAHQGRDLAAVLPAC